MTRALTLSFVATLSFASAVHAQEEPTAAPAVSDEAAPTAPDADAVTDADADAAPDADAVPDADADADADAVAEDTAPVAPGPPPTTLPPAEGEPASGTSDGGLDRLPPLEKDPLAPRDGTLPVTSLGPQFMDTRLSFSFSDDDWLKGPGETTPSSPFVDFAPRSNNQFFFDNLNRKDSGYETLTHLVLHRRQEGFIPGLETEAAIVARVRIVSDDETGVFSTAINDDGSYLRLRYFFSGSLKDEDAPNIDVVAFPFNSDRFRLGYLYDISWAGIDIYPRPKVAAPALKAQLNLWDGYVFVGAKTARLLDETPGIQTNESYWGGLAGGGWDMFDVLSFDVGGGLFHRGTNPNPGVQGEPVLGYGGSGRVALHLGRGVPGSIDFRLYRSDPAMADLFSVVRRSRTGMSFLAALEYSHLQQTLQDPDNLRSTKIQAGNAGALSTRFGWNNLEIGADAIYRDLAFVLFNRPGYTSFQDFSVNSSVTPEFLFALSASWFLESLHLTPGLVFGVQLPASIAGLDPRRVEEANGVDYAKSQVVVVRDIGSQDILPCNNYDDSEGFRDCVEPQLAEPIYAMRGAIKWDLSEMLALVFETTFVVDNNETRIIDSATGIASRERFSNVDFLPAILLPGTTAPHNLRISGGVFAQARF